MPSAEYDLRYLRAGLVMLEKYLLSNELYWPIGTHPPAGEPPYPRLTLSAMLLARRRVHARPLDADQRAALAEMEQQMDALRSNWRVAWGKKAVAEFRARLTLWRNFMEEYRDKPDANADRYGYEVGRRVQLHLLAPDAGDVPQSELELLNGLDKLLRAVFVPGDFTWEAELEPAFPKDPFWYLYGRLREQ